jgi:Domain of unknown function (DUF5063)
VVNETVSAVAAQRHRVRLHDSNSMTPEQNEIVASFIAEAKAYCDIVDGHEGISLGRFVRQLAIRIVRLYAAALLLPDVTSQISDSSEPLADAFTHEQESALTRALEEKLGTYNTYREIFDPYDEPTEEAVYGSLGRDLAEIYRDLRDVLAAYELKNQDTVHDILWSTRFQFEHYWGEHATKALRVIDSLLYRQYVEVRDRDA